MKVEAIESNKIKVSCESEPKAFDTFEVSVIRAGGGAHSEDTKYSVHFYSVASAQLTVSIPLVCSFIGDKQ